jgi:hypothetical protein
MDFLPADQGLPEANRVLSLAEAEKQRMINEAYQGAGSDRLIGLEVGQGAFRTGYHRPRVGRCQWIQSTRCRENDETLQIKSQEQKQ